MPTIQEILAAQQAKKQAAAQPAIQNAPSTDEIALASAPEQVTPPAPVETPTMERNESVDPLDRLAMADSDALVASTLSPGEVLAKDIDGLPHEELVAKFRTNLDQLPAILGDGPLLGEFLRVIMIQLQTHPFLKEHVKPVDLGMMVRGMKESMGVAQIKKSEAKAKRGGGKSTSGGKAVDQGVDDILNGLGL